MLALIGSEKRSEAVCRRDLRAGPRVSFAYADVTVVLYSFSVFTTDSLHRRLVGYELLL